MAVGAVVFWSALTLFVFDILDRQESVRRYIRWYKERYGEPPEDLPVGWETPKWYEKRPYMSDEERLAWKVFDEVIEEVGREIIVAGAVGKLFKYSTIAFNELGRTIVDLILRKGGADSETAKLLGEYLKRNPHLNVEGRYILDPNTGEIVLQLQRDTGMSFSFGRFYERYVYAVSQPVEWALEWQIAVAQWNFLRRFRDQIAKHNPYAWGFLTYNRIEDLLLTLRHMLESGYYDEIRFHPIDRRLWVDPAKAPEGTHINVINTPNGIRVETCRRSLSWFFKEYCGVIGDDSGYMAQYREVNGGGEKIQGESVGVSYSVPSLCGTIYVPAVLAPETAERPKQYQFIREEKKIAVETDKFTYDAKKGYTTAKSDAFFFCTLPADNLRLGDIATRLGVPITWTQTQTGWIGNFVYETQGDFPALFYSLRVEGRVYIDDAVMWEGVSHCGGFIQLDPILRRGSEITVYLSIVTHPDSPVRVYLPQRFKKIRLRGKEGELCTAVVPNERAIANTINPRWGVRSGIDYYESSLDTITEVKSHIIDAKARPADPPSPQSVNAVEYYNQFSTLYRIQRFRDSEGNLVKNEVFVYSQFTRKSINAQYARNPDTGALEGSTEGFYWTATSRFTLSLITDSARTKRFVRVFLKDICPKEGKPFRPRIVCSFQ